MINKITIILPLLDKEEYTKTWIDTNITSEFEYIIADGSSNNKNQLIFEKYNFPNVNYIKYSYDKNTVDWINKMADSALKSKTDYTMTVDNDDFLNFEGIKKCIQTLEKNKEYDIASGNIHFVRSVNNSKKNVCKYKLEYQKVNFYGYKNVNGYKAIEKYFNTDSNSKVSYVWYSVYKTSLYQKVWNTLKESNIFDVHLTEYLQTQLSLSFGNFVPVNTNHYIRLSNPKIKSTNRLVNKEGSIANRFLFNDEARDKFLCMLKFISGFNIGKEKELKNLYTNYFTVKKQKVHRKTLLKLIINFIKDLCLWFFSKFYSYSLNKILSFKIENIRVIIYKYYLIRSYVKNDN